jgi:hypothetical protein
VGIRRKTRPPFSVTLLFTNRSKCYEPSQAIEGSTGKNNTGPSVPKRKESLESMTLAGLADDVATMLIGSAVSLFAGEKWNRHL